MMRKCYQQGCMKLAYIQHHESLPGKAPALACCAAKRSRGDVVSS